jgi:beta-mannosidase
VFDGLDTIATVWLNGQEVGQSDNMLISHRFDITDQLRHDGENALVVRLGSALREAQRYEYPPGLLSPDDRPESLWIRKAPHMYGWDILPRIVSAGIWRSVRLEAIPAVHIEDLYFWTDGITLDDPRLGVHIRASGTPHDFDTLSLRLRGVCGDSHFDHTQPLEFPQGRFVVTVPNGRLWWPRDYGDPWLYDVEAELLVGDAVVDRRTQRIGLRELRLDRTEAGGPDGRFRFVINGTSIQISGSNWVPLDAVHSRDIERVDAALALAADVNCRMLRGWGGNVYESDRFYDLCDEYGILVWQDFAFACARYPQTDEFAARVAREAASVITRLRNHASLAVWCGDNECDDNWVVGELRPEMNRLTREVLPRAVRTYDPYRPFVPSSPYIAPGITLNPTYSTQLPEQHLWGPRASFKSPFYSQHTAHFIGETGYHGCPSPSSLARFIPAEQLWPWDNPSWRAHAVEHWRRQRRDYDRNELMVNQVREFFGEVPATLAEFAMASQIVQAEALKFFIEHARLLWPSCSGILWWNLIDGWPQLSDAVVDYYFSKKLAYFYIRRMQQPLCLLMDEPDGWESTLSIGNVGRRERQGHYRVWDASDGSEILAGIFAAAANTNTVLGQVRASLGVPRLLIMEWESDDVHGASHYLMGNAPFDFARYRDRWLPKLAALHAGFSLAEIAR